MKQIIVNNCTECPFVGHTGGFTKGGAKPCCDHDQTVKEKGSDCFKRVIPYKNEYLQERLVRVPKSIPNWCPL